MNHAKSNHVNSNCTDLNQFTIFDSTTINYSSDIFLLNKILSWCGESTDTAAGTVSTLPALSYGPTIHIAYTPSTLHSLNSYSPFTAP